MDFPIKKHEFHNFYGVYGNLTEKVEINASFSSIPFYRKARIVIPDPWNNLILVDNILYYFTLNEEDDTTFRVWVS
jgi:hypothetical protein